MFGNSIRIISGLILHEKTPWFGNAQFSKKKSYFHRNKIERIKVEYFLFKNHCESSFFFRSADSLKEVQWQPER